MMNELKPLIEIIERNESFLLVSHIDPDGDAIGSLIAMLNLLESRGKKVVAYDRDGVPEIYKFLKHSDRITSTIPTSETFDVMIFIECPNPGRAGAEAQEFAERIPERVNLDHHEDNTGYGTLNILKPEFSAAAEIIYRLFEDMGEPIDDVVAEALYTAIMTDTGSYKYSNTSPECHRISADLLETGIKPNAVYQKVYENLTPAAAFITAKAYGTLEIEDSISSITITRKMLEEAGATPEDTHDIVSFGRAIEDIEVALLFRETEADIKVSLRSRNLNVSKIAASFEGGGHRRAAGCNIKGSMEEVKGKVLAAVRKALAEAGEELAGAGE